MCGGPEAVLGLLSMAGEVSSPGETSVRKPYLTWVVATCTEEVMVHTT